MRLKLQTAAEEVLKMMEGYTKRPWAGLQQGRYMTKLENEHFPSKEFFSDDQVVTKYIKSRKTINEFDHMHI